MFIQANPKARRAAATVAIAGVGPFYSESFVLPVSIMQQLGFLINVSTPGTGTMTITPQTTTLDGDDAVPGDWVDCPLSVIEGFSLAASNTSRGMVADMVLDKFRFKFTGSAAAAGTLSIMVSGDLEIT